MNKESNPVSLPAYAAVGALFLLLILAFALVLRWDLQRLHPADPADWQEAPDALHWQCAAAEQGGAVVYEGYAFVPQDKFMTVNTWVALQHRDTGALYRVPTVMSVKIEETRTPDGKDHGRGGFSAVLKIDTLPGALQDYEVCILYGSDGHAILQRTGMDARGDRL